MARNDKNCFYNKTERYPSKPYIKDGYPQNLTVLVNSNASFECPQMIVDLEPYIFWIRSANDTQQVNITTAAARALKVSDHHSLIFTIHIFHVVMGTLAHIYVYYQIWWRVLFGYGLYICIIWSKRN